jgi:hypothetical protein
MDLVSQEAGLFVDQPSAIEDALLEGIFEALGHRNSIRHDTYTHEILLYVPHVLQDHPCPQHTREPQSRREYRLLPQAPGQA